MMVGTVDDRSGPLAELGISLNIATSIAEAQGPEMGQAILALYRAAAQPVMAEAGRDLENAAARPGLSILATEHPYVGTDESAEVLNRFWEALDLRSELVRPTWHDRTYVRGC